MAKIPERVDNDDEYNELLARIVKGAQTIEDPLLEAADREKYMLGYDKMVAVAREYRTRKDDSDGKGETAQAAGN